MSRKVSINTATRDELDTLDGIGPELAQRIIDYRARYGRFGRPDDLARVPGIGKRLARRLAQDIDWAMPSAPETPKARQPLHALLAIGIVTALVVTGYILIGGVRRRLLQYGQSYHWSVGLLVYLSYALLACIAATGITFVGETLTVVRKRARKWADYGLLVVTVEALVIVSIILTSAVGFFHYGFGGVRDFFGDPLTQATSGALVLFLLIFGPKMLVLLKPELAVSQLVARLYDWAWAAGVIFAFWQLWFNLHTLLAAFLLLQSVIGGLSAYQAYQVLVKRQSLFHASLDFLDPTPKPPLGEELLEILNRVMPSEEEQQLLARALSNKYRVSLRSRLVGAAVIGFVGWLVGEILGSVIELFVQSWVRQHTGIPPE